MTRGALSGAGWRGVIGFATVALAALVLGWFVARPTRSAPAPTHLALVLPDGFARDDVHVLAWVDAAAEAGFALDLVSASELLRPGRARADAALIVPDAIHRRMNDLLIAHLRSRVRAGARLMLVHDAGVEDMAGHYDPIESRLSSLAGVRYALYGEFGGGMVREQAVRVDARAVSDLRLPPGKLMRDDSDAPLTSARPAPTDDEELAVGGYHYGRLRYPVFATRGAFDGQRMMSGDHASVVAGVHREGRGEVLFVNLPLTYLKLRTDGLFLHGFLRYFAQDIAGLVQLSPMPDARGALIMNWHIDAATAVPAMEKLTALGAFDQGPYSVHLTAGPDNEVAGDGGGMDLEHNPTMRAWVRRFVERGDEVGSHGGWLHNGFGRLIDTQSHERSKGLIERNSAAVSGASGHPVREYSAPSGNHPAWVTPWLREHGIRAYYFTGDIGMPPTRSYQDGQRGPSDMWAFPVLSHGSDAAFEESSARGVPERDIAAWLIDVADYCRRYRTVRLVYFHPGGIAIFPGAFKRWLDHTADLVRGGGLRWMTMAQYADFANRRLDARWRVLAETEAPGAFRLEATHPRSLAHLSWLLPARGHARPQVLEGEARVERDGDDWRVIAGDGQRLVIALAPAGSIDTAPRRPAPSPSP